MTSMQARGEDQRGRVLVSFKYNRLIYSIKQTFNSLVHLNIYF